MACCCWSVKCGLLRLFLTRGADVFLKNREGETPPDCCSHNSKAWAALQANRRERDAKNIRLTRAEEKTLHRLKLYSYTCCTLLNKVSNQKYQLKNGCRWKDKILSRKVRLSNALKDLSDGKTLQFWPWHFFCQGHCIRLTLKTLRAPNQHLLCLQWHRSGPGESSHSLCQLCRQWTVSWRLQVHPRKLCHLPNEHRQEHNTLTGELETISSGILKETKRLLFCVWQYDVTNVIFSLYLRLTVLCL